MSGRGAQLLPDGEGGVSIGDVGGRRRCDGGRSRQPCRQGDERAHPGLALAAPPTLRRPWSALAMGGKTRAQHVRAPHSGHPPFVSWMRLCRGTVKMLGEIFVPPEKRKDGSPVREECPKKIHQKWRFQAKNVRLSQLNGTIIATSAKFTILCTIYLFVHSLYCF